MSGNERQIQAEIQELKKQLEQQDRQLAQQQESIRQLAAAAGDHPVINGLHPELVVRNTFIEHVDDNPNLDMRRVSSDSDISSKAASSSRKSKAKSDANQSPTPQQHYLWGSADSTFGSSSVSSSRFSSQHSHGEGDAFIPDEPRPHSVLNEAVLTTGSSSSSTCNNGVQHLGVELQRHVEYSINASTLSRGDAYNAFQEKMLRPGEPEVSCSAYNNAGPTEHGREDDTFIDREDDTFIDFWPECGDLPSIGSLLHHEGQCKPCHYVFMKRGCANGESCEFCHYPHYKAKRRPCKEQRDGYKRLIEKLNDEPDPVQAVKKALSESEKKPYLRNKLNDKLKMLEQEEKAQLSMPQLGPGCRMSL